MALKTCPTLIVRLSSQVNGGSYLTVVIVVKTPSNGPLPADAVTYAVPY